MTREEFMVYEGISTPSSTIRRFLFQSQLHRRVHGSFQAGPQTPQVLHGPAEFIEKLQGPASKFQGVSQPGHLPSDEKNMIVEFHTEFHCMNDTLFQGSPMKRGEYFAVNQFCVYDFDEKGKFSRIRISHFRVLSNDPNFKPLHSLDEG
jgi:hypothetical protein